MGKKKYRVVPVKPTEFSQWDKFVETSHSGSIYHLSSYLGVLANVTGGHFHIVAVRLEDKIVAGAALFERPLILGCYSSSRLLLYYHGLVLGPATLRKNGKEVRTSALEPLEKYLCSFGYAFVSMYHRHPLCDLRVFSRAGWQLQLGYTYEVSLIDKIALWRRIDQNQRRLIRRAENSGYTLSEDDDFESFFRQHEEVHQRKAAPIYLNQGRFEKYFHLLREKGLCRLYHVRTESDESAASQLVLLSSHPVTHTVCAAAHERFLGEGVTPFLRWKVFETLSKEGYLGNDLTDAGLHSVARFKRDMGGELRRCIRVTKQFDKTFALHLLANRTLNKVKKILNLNHYSY